MLCKLRRPTAVVRVPVEPGNQPTAAREKVVVVVCSLAPGPFHEVSPHFLQSRRAAPYRTAPHRRTGASWTSSCRCSLFPRSPRRHHHRRGVSDGKKKKKSPSLVSVGITMIFYRLRCPSKPVEIRLVVRSVTVEIVAWMKYVQVVSFCECCRVPGNL